MRRPPDPAARIRALRLRVARSSRLELSWPDPRYGSELLRLIDEPQVARWTLHIPSPYRPRDLVSFYARARRFHRDGSALSLQIVRRRDGALLGGLGLHEIDAEHRRAEVGYWVGAPYRRQGYGLEAVHTLCSFAFRQLGLARLQAEVFRGNRASERLLRAAGFRREGLLRGHARKDGAAFDVVVYGRLRGDPVPPAGRPARAGRSSAAPAAPTR
jgi:[ribosomal protein S5]-alanine N-acetyltransferase